MGKTRFSVLDLSVQARALNARLSGARVVNVYDVSGRTYLLKLSVPPARPGGAWSKQLLLLESGARAHTTAYARDTGAVPSGFALKLRKHLRTRRLDGVAQLRADRALVLTFSAGGERVAVLFVEFYAGGNVVLADGGGVVLAMLRVLRPRGGGTVAAVAAKAAGGDGGGAEGEGVVGGGLKVGDVYPVEAARGERDVGVGDVREALAGAVAELDGGPVAEGRAARRRRAQAGEARRALAARLGTGPQQVEHALVRAGLAAGVGVREMCGVDDGVVERLCAGMREVADLVKGGVPRGYVYVKEGGELEDVLPFVLAQYEGRVCEEFETFDEAVDSYFVRLEMGRAEAAKKKREAAAYRKVDRLTAELRGQVTALEKAQVKSREKAQAIESNIVEVEAAVAVVSSALAAAVDWEHLGRMVEEEKKNANPVAEIIHSLHLDRNEITLMLEDAWGTGEEDEEEEDEGEDDGGEDEDGEDDGEKDGDDRGHGRAFERSAATREVLLVDVDLSLSAHANAREYYALKKTAAIKMEKAVEATDRTIKAASRKAAVDAQKMEADAAASSIRAKRHPHWFEKFHWMVSSENYLIVAGRDVQQNDLLVSRYMAPADAYVHADVHGAASVLVKNRKPPGASAYTDIPRITLDQAGSFAMCRSKAWADKIVTSAWWVRAAQVSKTAPTGVSLAAGSFVIRGKKNFLDPAQLVMGFAFLFKVDEASASRHRGERAVRGADVQAVAAVPETALGGNGSDSDGDEPEDGGVVIVGAQEQASQDDGETGPAVAGEVTTPTANDAADGARSGSSDDNGRRPSATEGADADGGDNVGAQASEQTSSRTDVELFAKFGTGSSSKYGLEAADDEGAKSDGGDVNAGQVPAGDNNGESMPKTGKRRMSAKERRQLKSGKLNKSPDDSSADAANRAVDAHPVPAPSPARKKGPVTAPVSLPRGKRGKLKKMKRKYGDQDEEERELALAVLGARKVKELNGSTGSAERESNGTDKVLASAGVEKGASEMPKGKTKGKGAKNAGAAAGPRQDNQGGHDGRNGRQGRPDRKRDSNASSDVTTLRSDADIAADLAKLEADSSTVLDVLTGAPHADDTVEYALPVCAPYGALGGYRYRAKLLPGGMKRGKAYRASVGLFLRQAEQELRARGAERDAMRLCVEGDALQTMLPGVRVMAAGISEGVKGGRRKKGGGGGGGAGKK